MNWRIILIASINKTTIISHFLWMNERWKESSTTLNSINLPSSFHHEDLHPKKMFDHFQTKYQLNDPYWIIVWFRKYVMVVNRLDRFIYVRLTAERKRPNERERGKRDGEMFNWWNEWWQVKHTDWKKRKKRQWSSLISEERINHLVSMPLVNWQIFSRQIFANRSIGLKTDEHMAWRRRHDEIRCLLIDLSPW